MVNIAVYVVCAFLVFCPAGAWKLVLGGNHISLGLFGERSAHHGLVEEAGQLGAAARLVIGQEELYCRLHHRALPLRLCFSVPARAAVSLGQANSLQDS